MIAVCACGKVEIEAVGTPITISVCYCDDCQEGARQIEVLPGAPPILDTGGGSAYLVYRKDRVSCSRGAELLKPLKIRAMSPTNRVIAACCNSAMMLSFDDDKHWIDIYRDRVRGTAPPPRMHVCTRFKRPGQGAPSDIPTYAGYPVKFLAQLAKARLEMSLARIFRRRGA
ncbi:MAG: hypothetical protein WAU49_10685 [Steroidobacteraceae bacterium]